MDMIRWLASNIVVQVAWGLGLLAVALAFLFGGTKSADEHATVETSPIEVVAEAEVVAEPVAVVQAAVATAAVTTAVAAVSTEVKEEAAPVEAVAEASTEVVDTVVVEVPATDEAVVAEVTEVEAPVVEAPVVEEALAVESIEAEAVLDSASVEGKSSDDILMMAREAYWNNGLDEAAELYGFLIEREPNVIEHKGELGNVLWKQGYPAKAAELYAEIAAPMIEKGNGERVSNMVGFIGLFYPARAASIRELLAAN
ncbi:tetratricopeptide repeat protein [Leucothrix arctica]|uniref:Uncharacterized protein n=1 Tax=Leucothrix arctica TaxID=1481894 RepID=A0A317CKB9_9GAMM|nr:tetratricopeptide repeat protein [Leucothrix arctica]PWQ98779.1 hypothetical protein DKT75_02945 [Leucothrix arctica]